ncbi:MAG TPA: STAS/SEC14 domain-containing protein [Candidatus Binataceae bacterium]|nr:STAS/SEC14 domain-containing protein [Candidatus Binataceae bacterium]
MVEILKGLPDYVVGFIGKGRVTRTDYLDTVIPAVEAARKDHAKLRLYYELGAQFSEIDFGAEWEDLKLGVEHLLVWERIAIVTDVPWIRHLVGALRFLMPAQVRVFTAAQSSEARAWIVAA